MRNVTCHTSVNNPNFTTCIADHRPEWKLGIIWTCPKCGQRFEAINNVPPDVKSNGWLFLDN